MIKITALGKEETKWAPGKYVLLFPLILNVFPFVNVFISIISNDLQEVRQENVFFFLFLHPSDWPGTEAGGTAEAETV